jgi:hypothetical protein
MHSSEAGSATVFDERLHGVVERQRLVRHAQVVEFVLRAQLEAGLGLPWRRVGPVCGHGHGVRSLRVGFERKHCPTGVFKQAFNGRGSGGGAPGTAGSATSRAPPLWARRRVRPRPPGPGPAEQREQRALHRPGHVERHQRPDHAARQRRAVASQARSGGVATRNRPTSGPRRRPCRTGRRRRPCRRARTTPERPQSGGVHGDDVAQRGRTDGGHGRLLQGLASEGSRVRGRAVDYPAGSAISPALSAPWRRPRPPRASLSGPVLFFGRVGAPVAFTSSGAFGR